MPPANPKLPTPLLGARWVFSPLRVFPLVCGVFLFNDFRQKKDPILPLRHKRRDSGCRTGENIFVTKATTTPRNHHGVL